MTAPLKHAAQLSAERAQTTSFYEASARTRVELLLDSGSFVEFVGPEKREVSPHLKIFDLPEQFDDGIVVGRGRLTVRPCSLPHRKAVSWAAPSAKCTAPS